MPELTLVRVEPGRYALGEMGTLSTGRRFAAAIEAAGSSWRLRRAWGVGAVVIATDAGTGALAARYLPSGFLRLRGIYRGTIEIGDRELDWRADQHMGEHFTLRDSDEVLARFEARAEPAPVTVSLYGLHHLDALPLLLCCYIVKRVVDMTMEVGTMGPPVAAVGG